MFEIARRAGLLARGTLQDREDCAVQHPTIERSATMRITPGSAIRRTIVLSFVLGLLLVAAPRANAVPPSIGESGISGLVYQRTECAASEGCFQPARAMVTAVAQNNSVNATYRATSDRGGSFVLWLEPGLYRLTAATLGANSQQSKPMLVRVYPGFLIGLRIAIPAH
jgi:hypothetical protein